MGDQEEQGRTKKQSQCLHGTYGNRLAGQPADYRVMEGQSPPPARV